jgi:uncharacterized protein
MQVDPRTLTVPAPTPTGETEAFWEACSREEFTLQFCTDCDHWVFYPRAACPFCWSPALEWRQASGTGAVRSFTVVHKPGHPGWAMAAPYTVAVISLAEGPTMLTALVGIAPEDVRVGLPVRVEFMQVGEYMLPFFTPSKGQAA